MHRLSDLGLAFCVVARRVGEPGRRTVRNWRMKKVNMVASTVSERVASADAAKKELARSRSTRRDARSRPARMLVGLNVEMRR